MSASSTMVENNQPDDKFFGAVRFTDADGIDYNDPNNILTMKNIHKTYLLGLEGVPALRGVSMSIKRGEFVCIFGTSGGGKTTMLNIIGTIDKPTKGDMKLCGKTINHKTTDKDLAYLRLKNIGFVFQTFNLLSSLTALENVEMPMILLGELSASERRERAISLLTKVGMKERLDHVPSQLSGGEQQRVTIARAMANNPDILLLDEPTGDLDTINTAIVMKLLTDLNKTENVTLVMVTHDVGLKMYGDRIIWMRDGKIQRIETVNELAKKEHYEKLYRDVEVIRQHQKGAIKSVIINENQSSKKITEMRRPHDYKSLSSSFLVENKNINNTSKSSSNGKNNNHTNNNNNDKKFDSPINNSQYNNQNINQQNNRNNNNNDNNNQILLNIDDFGPSSSNSNSTFNPFLTTTTTTNTNQFNNNNSFTNNSNNNNNNTKKANNTDLLLQINDDDDNMTKVTNNFESIL